jgi:hypothetical protein
MSSYYFFVSQLDLSLSPLFYTWLQGRSKTLTLADVRLLDVDIHRNLVGLQAVASQYDAIKRNEALVVFLVFLSCSFFGLLIV